MKRNYREAIPKITAPEQKAGNALNLVRCPPVIQHFWRVRKKAG